MWFSARGELGGRSPSPGGPGARSRARDAALRLNLAREVAPLDLAAWAEVPGLPDDVLEQLRKAG